MKFLALFRALPFGARSIEPHNDNLRAGQFGERPVFSPWTMFVS